MDMADLAARVDAATASVEGVAAVYLFGSVAAGTDTHASDVDLGILYESAPASTLDAGPLVLEGDLERRLGRQVQLVALNAAPPELRIQVMRAQRLLVDRNRCASGSRSRLATSSSISSRCSSSTADRATAAPDRIAPVHAARDTILTGTSRAIVKPIRS